MNAVISQLRFFTIYVLHKPWVDSQLPKRKFDEYMPFIPSHMDTFSFISTIPDIKAKAFITLLYYAGLRSGEVQHLKCSDIEHSNMRIFIRKGKNRSSRYPFFQKEHGIRYWNTGIRFPRICVPQTGCLPNSEIGTSRLTTSIPLTISGIMKYAWGGNTAYPAYISTCYWHSPLRKRNRFTYD